MEDLILKNPAELAARLSLKDAQRLLVVDAPPPLEQLLLQDRPMERPLSSVSAAAIRSVKESFDAILLWRENRVGSRSLFEALLKRLEPSAALWVVTAMKKVIGPKTPAVHRLELADLVKAFSREGLTQDREVRVSAWHVAYRFVRDITRRRERISLRSGRSDSLPPPSACIASPRGSRRRRRLERKG